MAQNKNARHVTAAISCILKSRFEFFFRNRFSRSASDLDVDPPRFLPPSNCYGGGISYRRPRGDTLLALFPEFSAWVRSSASFCSFPVQNGIGVSANAAGPIIGRGPSISVFVCLPTPRSCVLQKRLNGSRCRLEWGQTRVEPKSHHFSKSVSKTPLHSVTGLQGAVQIHTHPFNASLFRTTLVGRYQKGKTNLDFTEARDSEWQWHQLGHMQVCTSHQTDNHASTPPLSVLQAGCPSCPPTNSVKALKAKARQDAVQILNYYYYAAAQN